MCGRDSTHWCCSLQACGRKLNIEITWAKTMDFTPPFPPTYFGDLFDVVAPHKPAHFCAKHDLSVSCSFCGVRDSSPWWYHPYSCKIHENQSREQGNNSLPWWPVHALTQFHWPRTVRHWCGWGLRKMWDRSPKIGRDTWTQTPTLGWLLWLLEKTEWC